MKIEDFIEKKETRGKLFLARYGKTTLLLYGLSYPSNHFEEKNSFVNLLGGNVYYYSSVKNSRILNVWKDISYIPIALLKKEEIEENENN